jgi:hypothetical protein
MGLRAMVKRTNKPLPNIINPRKDLSKSDEKNNELNNARTHKNRIIPNLVSFLNINLPIIVCAKKIKTNSIIGI